MTSFALSGPPAPFADTKEIPGEITEALIRKRAEHNEGELSSLREIALHQFELKGINTVLGRICKGLQILLLQNNLIPELTNLHRLKDLVYLNVAINNLTSISGLSRCESLAKLDCTVNFIWDLVSISSLTANTRLRELYLTGNPVTAYDGYRNYVIATLPQLTRLDGIDITRTERIAAAQAAPDLTDSIKAQQKAYKAKLDAKEDKRKNSGRDDDDDDDDNSEDEEADNPLYPHTPEGRLALHQSIQDKRDAAKNAAEPPKHSHHDRPPSQGVAPSSLPSRLERLMQRNDGRWDFRWDEESSTETITLEIEVGKYVDTSLIDLDVKPDHICMTIKGATLKLRTPEEIAPDSTKAERSSVTGNLLLTLARVSPVIIPAARAEAQKKAALQAQRDLLLGKKDGKENSTNSSSSSSFLSGEGKKKAWEDIAGSNKSGSTGSGGSKVTPMGNTAFWSGTVPEKLPSSDFVDDPDVPPLE